jgi:hypothetical protein
MKIVRLVPVLGVVVMVAACPRPSDPDPIQFSLICEAELKDTSGMVVATIEDTVSFDARVDTVGTDPRPCKSSYRVGQASFTLNAKSASADTVSGSPTD